MPATNKVPTRLVSNDPYPNPSIRSSAAVVPLLTVQSFFHATQARAIEMSSLRMAISSSKCGIIIVIIRTHPECIPNNIQLFQGTFDGKDPTERITQIVTQHTQRRHQPDEHRPQDP